MKHLLLFLEGLAGDAAMALDGRTPLEAAERLHLDAMSMGGRPAAVEADPWGRSTTDEALLGLAVGIDPALDPLGPAILAGAARGDAAPEGTVRLALDLVTIEAGVMLHADAGGLTDEEGRVIAEALAPAARAIDPAARVGLVAGHRLHLDLPATASPDPLGLVPPASLVGEAVLRAAPSGEGSEPLRAFIEVAAETLARLEVVELRREAGLPAPTHAWPWGLGRGGRRLDLAARYEGRRAAVVGTGEAEGGLAALAGIAHRSTAGGDPGSFVEAVEAALAADVVIAWWRCTADPTDAVGRSAAATAADRLVVGPLRERLVARAGSDRRMAVVAGPARSTGDGRLLAVPLMAAFEGAGFHGPLELPFLEASADEAELRFRPGDDLLDYLLFGAGVRRPRRPRRARPGDPAPLVTEPRDG